MASDIPWKALAAYLGEALAHTRALFVTPSPYIANTFQKEIKSGT